MARKRERIGILDIFGLRPLNQAVRDGLKAVFGENEIPPAQFDLSSIKIFKPHLSLPTWVGIRTHGAKAPIYNFYNRNMPGRDTPFSVKVTTCRDWRGGQYTYDSHPGTDFAIPVGTPLVTCAPGRVMAVKNQLDHGGLKIFVDHGQGLITTYAHLSRALVRDGEPVRRGQVIALSGAAGLELILFFPWVAPHLHLNVVLNGAPVDPFGITEQGETPLWRAGNAPVPFANAGAGADDEPAADQEFEPTAWDEARIRAAIEDCSDPAEREKLLAVPDLEHRAAEVINYRMFYNTLFSKFPPVYDREYLRRPVLDLPFRAGDYDGVAFP